MQVTKPLVKRILLLVLKLLLVSYQVRKKKSISYVGFDMTKIFPILSEFPGFYTFNFKHWSSLYSEFQKFKLHQSCFEKFKPSFAKTNVFETGIYVHH